MPEFETRHFGLIAFDESDVLSFRHGLPGFESSCRFLLLSYRHTAPLVYLQSLEDPSLCFLTLPVLAVDGGYRLEASREDLALIGLPPRVQPRSCGDVLCLAVLSLREEGAAANMLAPIVINLRNRQAVQAVCLGYSLQHPLSTAKAQQEQEAVSC